MRSKPFTTNAALAALACWSGLASAHYVESDPLGLAAGLNTYAYVQSSPLAHSDRTGLITDCELDALRQIVNKYGAYPHVNEQNFCVDPKMKGHYGETSYWTGRANIGTNPNEPDQYSGSVIERHQTTALLITGLHENAHQSEMNGDAPLSFFMDSFMEKITGGNTSGADDYAINTMMKNPQIEGEYLQKVGQCKAMHPGQ